MKQKGVQYLQTINIRKMIDDLVCCYGMPGQSLQSCDNCSFKNISNNKDCTCKDVLMIATIASLCKLQTGLDSYIGGLHQSLIDHEKDKSYIASTKGDLDCLNEIRDNFEGTYCRLFHKDSIEKMIEECKAAYGNIKQTEER